MRDHEGPETRDAGQLPAAARAVQDRPRPAGRARGRALAGRVRRPRGREQLGRRRCPSTPDPRVPRAAGGGVPGVLREHAAAARPRSPAASTCSSTGGCAGGGWPRSTCSTPGSTATTRPAATATRTARRHRPGAARSPAPSRRRGCSTASASSTARWDILGQQVFFAQRDNNAGPAHGHQHGRLGRLRRLPRPDHPGLGRRRGTQPGGAHRRRARALGQRPQARLRRPDLAHRRHRAGLLLDHLDAATARTRSPARTRGSRSTRTCASTTTCGATSARRSPRTQLTADFDVLPYVSRPDAPAYTRASFVIEDRVPGLHQTADNPVPSAARSATPSADPGQQTVQQETVRP